jgi:DUF438 domain-containing protein
MSELIDNRARRIQMLQSAMRRLHDGASEEAVRSELEAVLAETDYDDVFLMEQGLIASGISPEAIRQLCDAHTRVLKSRLDQVQTPDAEPGHPVHTFRAENHALAKACAEARWQAERLANSVDTVEEAEAKEGLLAGLHALTDMDKHYRRKENLLFPFFERYGFTGPPTVMWAKDDEARSLLHRAIGAAKTATPREAAAAANAALDALEGMIYKEEKVLLPTAMRLLTEQDWYEIALQSDEIGYCLTAPETVWKPHGGVQSPEEDSGASEGFIRMPTGRFRLEELVAVLATLPFDLTFVDAEDTVRYFSPGRDRIFSRSKAVLGRKVQYCHPPKSVHVVDQTLSDFREGRRDRARFWINLRGRFVMIGYYAVRDESGNYLGTLEVTQDATEVRGLQGERRLLEYDEED